MVIAALLSLAALTPAARAQDAKVTAGAISGKVTVDGKPARGVTVIAEPTGEIRSASENTTKLEAKTDEAGHYQLIDVPWARLHTWRLLLQETYQTPGS